MTKPSPLSSEKTLLRQRRDIYFTKFLDASKRREEHLKNFDSYSKQFDVLWSQLESAAAQQGWSDDLLDFEAHLLPFSRVDARASILKKKFDELDKKHRFYRSLAAFFFSRANDGFGDMMKVYSESGKKGESDSVENGGETEVQEEPEDEKNKSAFEKRNREADSKILMKKLILKLLMGPVKLKKASLRGMLNGSESTPQLTTTESSNSTSDISSSTSTLSSISTLEEEEDTYSIDLPMLRAWQTSEVALKIFTQSQSFTSQLALIGSQLLPLYQEQSKIVDCFLNHSPMMGRFKFKEIWTIWPKAMVEWFGLREAEEELVDLVPELILLSREYAQS